MSREFYHRLDALEREHALARWLEAYRESEEQRAKRNAIIARDPQAWRAAEIELRRAGEFERAVYCQQIADGLEPATTGEKGKL